MSTLKVNTLQDTSGNTLTRIGQIVETKITDTKSLACTNSFQDMSGFTVSITPTATNSKILVRAMINHANRSNHIGGRLVRSVGGTVTIPTGWVGDADGSRTQTSIGNTYYQTAPNTDANGPICFEMIDDSHSTTSAITYKLQFFSYQSGSYTVYINRPTSDADASYTYRAVSSFIAMEILQ